MSFNIWTPQGLMQLLTGNSDLAAKSNPNVIYEGNPQILGGPNVFKMWCGIGGGATGIYYYESANGITNWTAHPSNPIVASAAGVAFPTLYKVASTYYLFTSPFSPSGNIGVQTSSDGVTFGAKTTIITTSGAGIEATGICQLNLVPGTPGFGTNTGETYYAYYEAVGGGQSYEVLVTSTDMLATWTRPNGLTPTFTGVAPMTFQKIGSKYYTWGPNSAVVPSLSSQTRAYNSLARWSAASPDGPWTVLKLPGTTQPAATIYHTQRTEFDVAGTNAYSTGTNPGDPYIISALGNMYAYWTRTGAGGGQYGLNMAVATSCTPAQQVAGYEGMVNYPLPMTDTNLNVLASDDFNRANANPIGGNWTKTFTTGTTSQIVSHIVEPSTVGAAADSHWNAVSFPNDQWSETTFHSAALNTSSLGANVRCITDGTVVAYRAYFTPVNNAITLQKLNTSATTLGSAGMSFSDTDRLRLVVVGTNLLVYYNGFPVLAATDAALASGPAGFNIGAGTVVTNAQISGWRGGGFQTGFGISGSAGVAGATVSYTGILLAGTVTADGSGNYAITGLVPDTYTVTASKNGYSFTPSSLNEVVTIASITGADFTATVVTTSQGPGFGINNGIVQSISPGVH